MPFGGALTAGAIGAGGSLLGGIFGSKGAKSAASTITNAAKQIGTQAQQAAGTATADVNAATGTANTGLQAASDTGNTGLNAALQSQISALSPYTQAGTQSLGQLQNILGPNGALNGPGSNFSFTPQDWQNDPGYNFLVQQQNQALQRSAAASGGLLTGGTIRAGARLNNNLASTQLDSAFNRALSTYQTNRQNLLTQISGLQNLTGTGLQASGQVNQDIGNTGQLVNTNVQNAARNIASNTVNAGTYAGNTGLQAAQIAAQALAGGASAQAAGTIGSTNALNGALGGITNAANRVVYGLPQNGGGGLNIPFNNTPATTTGSGTPGGLSNLDPLTLP